MSEQTQPHCEDCIKLDNLVKDFAERVFELSRQKEKLQETIDSLDFEKNAWQKKVKHLIEKKEELQAKVNEAQIIFEENLKYREEINTIREAVANECEASGIMEVMNMRIEDAESEAAEQERLRIIAETELEKEQEKCKKFVNDNMKLRTVLYNECNRDECENCGCWVDENEMESVKDNDWEEVLVCLDCRDRHFIECDECREYVVKQNIYLEEVTQRQLCGNCFNSDA